MGDTPSKGENGDGAEDTTYKPGDARTMFNHYQQSGVDAKTAVEAAWADDPFALKGIAKVVRQLEGDPEASSSEEEPEKDGNGEYKDADEAAKKAKRAAKKAEKARKVEQAKAAENKAANAIRTETKRADAQAGDWLKEEIDAGREENRVAEEKAAAARAAREEAVRKEHEARAKEQEKERARAIARAEADARAALWEDVADRQQREAAQVPIMNRVGGIPSPVQPKSDVPSEPVAPPPPLLPEKEKAATGKSKAKKAVPEFYKILDISIDATFDEIKKAYRKEALKWHPDKNRHQQEKATERFKKITEAFDTLFDPERRSKYDAGEIHDKGRVLKLQGHGWASLKDDDDAALTTLGWKYKRASWRGYVLMYGRIDDDPDQLVQDENDPRAPAEKIKVFWRHLGEMAHIDRENEEPDWLNNFIQKVWKDTPAKWPKGPELQRMNEAAQQEWKERRMVFNRRKQKILLHVELHQAYLDIPDREEKEFARLRKRNFSLVRDTKHEDFQEVLNPTLPTRASLRM